MISVKATREGLLGKTTASGYVIDRVVPFVALPAHDALYSFVVIRSPRSGKACLAIVLDVGPWNVNDESYVFKGQRPQSESDPHTNGAGIDLGEAVWQNLHMTDNDTVEWAFVAPGDAFASG